MVVYPSPLQVCGTLLSPSAVAELGSDGANAEYAQKLCEVAATFGAAHVPLVLEPGRAAFLQHMLAFAQVGSSLSYNFVARTSLMIGLLCHRSWSLGALSFLQHVLALAQVGSCPLWVPQSGACENDVSMKGCGDLMLESWSACFPPAHARLCAGVRFMWRF